MGDYLLHQSSHVTHVPRSNGSRVRDQRVDPASNLRHCEERCAGGECAGHDCRTESCIALHLWMTCLCWNGPFMRMHCSSLFYVVQMDPRDHPYQTPTEICHHGVNLFNPHPKGSETSWYEWLQTSLSRQGRQLVAWMNQIGTVETY